MRIHLVIAFFTILLSMFYNFSRQEYIVLVITIAAVIACEMLNTALEAIVDIVSPSYSKMAQLAKDVAAGAVLITALAAAAVGLFLFWDLTKFHEIFVFFFSYPLFILPLAVLAIFGLLFIFKGTSLPGKNKFKGKN